MKKLSTAQQPQIQSVFIIMSNLN